MNNQPETNRILHMLRAILFVATPVVAFIASSLIYFFLSTVGSELGVFFDSAVIFLGIIPFSVALWISLGLRWSHKEKTAKKVALVSLAIFTIIFVASSAISTIKTKPIVAIADSFSVPDQMHRKMTDNADSFRAAGVVPCIDLHAMGCPHVKRGWTAEGTKLLTIADLEAVLEKSGWTEVKIQDDNCQWNESHGNTPYCFAEGPVGEYEATVGISEKGMSLYLR